MNSTKVSLVTFFLRRILYYNTPDTIDPCLNSIRIHEVVVCSRVIKVAIPVVLMRRILNICIPNVVSHLVGVRTHSYDHASLIFIPSTPCFEVCRQESACKQCAWGQIWTFDNSPSAGPPGRSSEITIVRFPDLIPILTNRGLFADDEDVHGFVRFPRNASRRFSISATGSKGAKTWVRVNSTAFNRESK